MKGSFRSAKMCRQRLDRSREVPRAKITEVEIRPMRNEGNLKAFRLEMEDTVLEKYREAVREMSRVLTADIPIEDATF